VGSNAEGEQLGGVSEFGRADVNHDGRVSGIDALLIINELQQQGSRDVQASGEFVGVSAIDVGEVTAGMDAAAPDSSEAPSEPSTQVDQNWAQSVDAALAGVAGGTEDSDDESSADFVDQLAHASLF
jgi:hypothetical protein